MRFGVVSYFCGKFMIVFVFMLSMFMMFGVLVLLCVVEVGWVIVLGGLFLCGVYCILVLWLNYWLGNMLLVMLLLSELEWYFFGVEVDVVIGCEVVGEVFVGFC